jgi:hypothetical protein
LLEDARGHLALLNVASRRIRAIRKPASVRPDLEGLFHLVAWREDERALAFLGGRWSVDLMGNRWTKMRVPGTSDAPPFFDEGCFTPGGGALVSVYTGGSVPDAHRLFVSDALRNQFDAVAGDPGLTPFFGSTGCTRTGDGRVYLVGGSPTSLYAASASALDERSPFEP